MEMSTKWWYSGHTSGTDCDFTLDFTCCNVVFKLFSIDDIETKFEELF